MNSQGQFLFLYPDDPSQSFTFPYDKDSADFQLLKSLLENVQEAKDHHMRFTDALGQRISPSESGTIQDFIALQPFYISKMVPRTGKERADPIQIFIRDFDDKTHLVSVDPFSSVEDLRDDIEAKLEIAGELKADYRLTNIFGQTLDWFDRERETLARHFIRDGNNFQLFGRVKGGSFGIGFADITQSSKALHLKWSNNAPKWRHVTQKGLCLEGKCTNKACKAYDKWVIITKGVRIYDVLMDEHENKCPLCASYVKAEKCTFNNCKYGYTGMMIQKNGAKPKKVTSQEDIIVGNEYVLFGPETTGTAIWSTLKIFVKPLDQDKKEKETLCGICKEKLKLGNAKKDCGHLFHDTCLLKVKKSLSIECVLCHF